MIINDLPEHLFINYDKDIKYFEYQTNNLYHKQINKDNIKDDDHTILDLTSKNNKVLIALHPRIYHCLIDNLSEILYLDKYFKLNPMWQDFEFILDSSDIPESFYEKNGPTFFKFFLDVLKNKNINYRIINSLSISNNNNRNKRKANIIKINNSLLIKKTGPNKLYHFSTIYELYKEYEKDKSDNKIVYLSRNIKNKNYVNFVRQNDEEILEKFFKEHNCEIVFPENFKTFEDQIKYFGSVKTLIALTGSGLLNMLMMPENSNIVEIYTPIESAPIDPDTNAHKTIIATHHMYRDIAWANSHTYVSIKNELGSNSLDLIEKLKNNKILMDILK